MTSRSQRGALLADGWSIFITPC